jgi:hypothetical protein
MSKRCELQIQILNMKTIQEIAKWAIDNRCTKKIKDIDMYKTLTEAMHQVLRQPPVIGSVCNTCTWVELPDKTSICSVCAFEAPF